MYTGRTYSVKDFLQWTKTSILWILFLSSLPTALYVLGCKFLSLPWAPIAILGTAVSFIVGFKNNASYSRIWEARQIYGSIINDSRSFAYTLRDTLGGKKSDTVKNMFSRHYAWLTALRYQLREPRTWESMKTVASDNQFENTMFVVPEKQTPLEEELKKYLTVSELMYVLSKKNRATQLMAVQSEELARLKNEGRLNDFQWTQLQQNIIRLTEHQGKAERIKNFPYPRNFATITAFLLIIFIVAVPFGLLKEFDKLGDGTLLEGHTIWFNIPFSAIIAWSFHTLDKVGEITVDPFQGSANDVPITQISRTIEIDMRDMLDEENLPPAISPKDNIVL